METVNPNPARGFRARFRRLLRLEGVPSSVRRIIVGVIGGTILIIGIVMILLPGPAMLVIPLGLAVLATEFVWARLWLRRVRRMLNNAKKKFSTLRRE